MSVSFDQEIKRHSRPIEIYAIKYSCKMRLLGSVFVSQTSRSDAL